MSETQVTPPKSMAQTFVSAVRTPKARIQGYEISNEGLYRQAIFNVEGAVPRIFCMQHRDLIDAVKLLSGGNHSHVSFEEREVRMAIQFLMAPARNISAKLNGPN